MGRKLRRILSKKSGRSLGSVTVRHQGGRHKRFLRIIDFKRDKLDIPAVVESLEYDPNRGVDVALIKYTDGERRYILAPKELKIGDKVSSGKASAITPGSALPLAKIPIGTSIHNIEITPGKGGQMARGAGNSAMVQGREEEYVLIKLPSTEIKRFLPECFATIGQLGNEQIKSERVKNAGINRRRGIRPTVRGTAQNPGSHPHGGGEGRSGVGLKYPKTPYGKPAVGKTRKKRKYSDKLVVSRRKPGKHSN